MDPAGRTALLMGTHLCIACCSHLNNIWDFDWLEVTWQIKSMIIDKTRTCLNISVFLKLLSNKHYNNIHQPEIETFFKIESGRAHPQGYNKYMVPYIFSSSVIYILTLKHAPLGPLKDRQRYICNLWAVNPWLLKNVLLSPVVVFILVYSNFYCMKKVL